MRRYTVEIAGRAHVLEVEALSADLFRVQVAGQELEVRLKRAEDVAEAVISPEIAHPGPEGGPFRPPALESLPPLEPTALPPLAPPPALEEEAGLEVQAPMPGTVLAVLVAPGQAVARGTALLKLEAMKMTNEIRAHRDGVVDEVRVGPGESVGFGQVLVTLKDA